MRSIILAALLWPVTAIALPEHDERQYVVYVQCERIVAAVAILPGQPPVLVRVPQQRHAEIAAQVNYLSSRYPVTQVTLPAGSECQRT